MRASIQAAGCKLLYRQWVGTVQQDLSFKFDPYLPLIDPEHFTDIAFYRELEKIGYRQVLLGGTGVSNLAEVVTQIKRQTDLQVVLYPAGPDSLADADVVLLPDVMNTNSHHGRPFGSGAVSTAVNIARRGLNFLPLAYFIMGESTARWYYDAFLIKKPKVILGYATYARMVGYRFLALDYEDPELNIDPELITALRTIEGMHLVVSDEFTPASAVEARALGIDTVVTPSNLYEESSDPLAMAADFHRALLRPGAGTA
ncbi:MAG TPA: geranylgeranylglyceryl/heptaprenylglyceryl phosphate synthase [Nannocystis sp.]|jgi:heptaprenylglyceryl phosphate synthase